MTDGGKAAMSAGVAMPAAGRRAARGRIGEDAALRTLVDNGYRLLARNLRVGRGEIDLVCEHGDDIVFVEVKTRRGTAFGTPAEAVTGRKQRTLLALASLYLRRPALRNRPCRFDVVEVLLDGRDRPVRVDVLRDAFRA